MKTKYYLIFLPADIRWECCDCGTIYLTEDGAIACEEGHREEKEKNEGVPNSL